MSDDFYPGKDYPQPVQTDGEYFLYKITTTDGKEWYLRILGNGGNPDDFPILKSHPEVFGWEELMGMLMLVTKKPIDPKVIIEEIDTDPLETVSIVDGPQNGNDITKQFTNLYKNQDLTT